MNAYHLYKVDYSQQGWHDLLRFPERLPELCDMLDHHGEISDEYDEKFNIDLYLINHDNIRISDFNTLKMFLSEEEQIPEKMRINILRNVGENSIFQFVGDGGGLGFIIDIWENNDSMERGDEPIEIYTFWFEDYLN